jgi:DNA modification methylase
VQRAQTFDLHARRKRLYCCDNLPMMRSLPDGCCDLVYVDPPFASQTVRSTAAGASFDDRWSGGRQAFLDFLKPRIGEMHRLLSPRGSIYVHLDWRTVHYVKLLMDEAFGSGSFLNEIVWSYRTGGRSNRWFARKHDTILLYARRAGEHTFHVQRDGEFRTDGLNHDDEGRPYKTTKKGRLYFHPDGPAATDVWEIPFLSTVAKERTGYPSQKPEALLERMILASSNPGDVVADFFCGSGTALATAKRLGRAHLGCDINEQAIAIARERLRAVASPES